MEKEKEELTAILEGGKGEESLPSFDLSVLLESSSLFQSQESLECARDGPI